MYVVEITEDKLDNIVEHMAKGIKYFNKAIECLDEVRQDSHERSRYREDDYDDYEDERRMYRGGGKAMRRGGGRYSNY